MGVLLQAVHQGFTVTELTSNDFMSMICQFDITEVSTFPGGYVLQALFPGK